MHMHIRTHVLLPPTPVLLHLTFCANMICTVLVSNRAFVCTYVGTGLYRQVADLLYSGAVLCVDMYVHTVCVYGPRETGNTSRRLPGAVSTDCDHYNSAVTATSSLIHVSAAGTPIEQRISRTMLGSTKTPRMPFFVSFRRRLSCSRSVWRIVTAMRVKRRVTVPADASHAAEVS